MRLAALLPLLAVAGCATLGNQKYRRVEIASSPAGAQVRMNGLRVGPAPLSVSASTRDGAVFTFEWADGARASCALTTSVEPHWFVLDLLAGGLVGPVIDASTGRWRDLDRTRCVAHHPGGPS